MAARISPKLTQEWREKIQTSMIINRLQDFVFGNAEMDKSQVSAALGLLKKTLPDLSSTELGGPDGSPLAINIVRFTDLPTE